MEMKMMSRRQSKYLPDPTSPENLTRIGGRGVFLMHQLSDQVDFQDNGSTVEMRFALDNPRG